MINITNYILKAENIKPKKILFISDTHSEIFHEIDELIYQERPDFVLLTGDIIDRQEEKDDWNEILFWLKQINEKVPVFASLGNHEIQYGFKDKIVKKLKETGIHILDNEYQQFDDLFLYGYTPQIFKNDKYPNNFPTEREKTICLCHRPNDFYETNLMNENFLLTVSGHAHGGQWRLFGLSAYAPQQGMFPKYTNGFYFDNKLLVTRGLGNKTPLPRINNKPEIIILQIN